MPPVPAPFPFAKHPREWREIFAEWEEVAERLTAASVIPDVFDGGSRLPMTREWLRPGDQQGGIQ